MRAAAVFALALVAGPATAAVDVDLTRYADAERAGAVAAVKGRAYAERRMPDGAEVPLTGTTVVALPWSEALVRRLEALRDGARSSATAYRGTAALMQRAREAYEHELADAGGGDLVRRAVTDPAGRFDLGRLPEGRWLILGVADSFHETSTPKAGRKDREMFRRSPRLVGFRSRLMWLREIAVTPSEGADLDLTDRNVWFTGVIEERVLERVPGRR